MSYFFALLRLIPVLLIGFPAACPSAPQERTQFPPDIKSKAQLRREELYYLLKADNAKQLETEFKAKRLTIKEVNEAQFLITAAQEGAYECMKLLLSKGANANAADNYDRTPLHYVTMYKNPRYVALLLRYGADVNRRDRDNATPLAAAATNASHPIAALNYLLQHSRYTQRTLDEALVYAIRYRLYSLADMTLQTDSSFSFAPLVKAGTRLNGLIEWTDEEATPLIYAVQGGKLKYLQELVRLGANVFQKDRKGHTALWHARHPFGDDSEWTDLVVFLEKQERSQKRNKPRSKTGSRSR